VEDDGDKRLPEQRNRQVRRVLSDPADVADGYLRRRRAVELKHDPVMVGEMLRGDGCEHARRPIVRPYWPVAGVAGVVVAGSMEGWAPTGAAAVRQPATSRSVTANVAIRVSMRLMSLLLGRSARRRDGND